MRKRSLSRLVKTETEIRKKKRRRRIKTGLNLYLSENCRVPFPQIKSSQRELSITLKFARVRNDTQFLESNI